MPLDPQVAAHYAAQRAASDVFRAASITDIRKNADLTYNDRKKSPPVFAVEDTAVPVIV